MLAANDTAFRIVVEREVLDTAKGQKPNPYEYYDAIYYGEQLSALSTDFSYSVPSPYSASPFVFELVTTDMEKLADTIAYQLRPIIAGLASGTFELYLDDQQDFWDQYCNDEIEPVCQGLLRVMERPGDYKTAAAAYRQLQRHAPRNTKILHRLMIVYRKLKDVANEIKNIDASIKLQEALYLTGKNAHKKTIAISKQLNMWLGHTDKKGRAVNKPEEVLRLEKRRERLLKQKGKADKEKIELVVTALYNIKRP